MWCRGGVLTSLFMLHIIAKYGLHASHNMTYYAVLLYLPNYSTGRTNCGRCRFEPLMGLQLSLQWEYVRFDS